jgi:hypothetical protein
MNGDVAQTAAIPRRHGERVKLTLSGRLPNQRHVRAPLSQHTRAGRSHAENFISGLRLARVSLTKAGY